MGRGGVRGKGPAFGGDGRGRGRGRNSQQDQHHHQRQGRGTNQGRTQGHLGPGQVAVVTGGDPEGVGIMVVEEDLQGEDVRGLGGRGWGPTA
ncbi:hypothetical protein HS088_TW21G00892 [Tripterygium wilfordii]|uniref:Uncharacterized protein n=1 Tax=Tripterygium wilfordii TaxID=458696 RepID=A0A7J7C3L9_TRIWF|nr:hypothetical protein HS088_TW21G00892 [Tripterygium wilfordii]